MPFFSIIVPIYRAEAFLSQCVGSILHQSFSDFELLLVEDGSPDRCGELCDRFAKEDCRVRVFHQENQGVSAARNHGIAHAKGEWVLFVDADDLLVENALEQIHCAAAQMGYHDFLYWQHCGEKPCSVQTEFTLTPVPFEDIGRMWAVEHSIGFVWNKLFRRSVIAQYSVQFPTSLSYMEDNLFVLDYCRALRKENPHSKFVALNLPLYVYQNQNPNSITHTHGDSYVQMQFDIVPQLIAAAREFGCPKDQLDQMYVHYLNSVCYGIQLISQSKQLSFWKKRRIIRGLFRCKQAKEIHSYYASSNIYSVYYLPFVLRSPFLIRFWHNAKQEHPTLYYAYINIYPQRIFFSKRRAL